MLRALVIGVVEKSSWGATMSVRSSRSLGLLSRSLSTGSSDAGGRGLGFGAKNQSVRALPATTEPSMVLSSSSPSKNLVVASRRRVSFLASSASSSSSTSSSSSSLPSRSFAADAARSLDNNNSNPPSSTSSKKTTKIVPIPLAQTGEGIKECELVSWRVAEGDAVEEFGPLCEVQSDKAAVEITARHAGVVERLCFAEGDVVEVGATLCELRVAEEEEEGEDGEGEGDEGGVVVDVAGSSSSSSSPASKGHETSSSSSSSSISLASPAVRRVARELGLADLSAVAGTGPGGRVLKGDVERHVVAGGGGGGGVSSSSSSSPSSSSTPAPTTQPTTTTTTPSSSSSSSQSASQSPLVLSPRDAVVPLRGYRRAMVAAMESSLTVPHFHFMDEYDVGSLLAAREALAADRRLVDSGVAKLTLLPFVIKAISLALSMTSPSPTSSGTEGKLHALVNASLSPGGDSVVAHDDHNVGVAVDTPRGLVVPVVRRVQDLSVAEVAAELARLQKGLLTSSSGMLPEADLRGATITVSNIGSLGGAWATPLVHPPQAAIVALGRVRPRLVVVDKSSSGSGEEAEREERAWTASGGGGGDANKNGGGGKKSNNKNAPPPPHPPPHHHHHHPTLAAVPSLPMSWGADHRVVDGAGLARFAADVGALLSEPARMLLHSR